ARLGGGGVLPLGEPIDLVVEQQDRDVDVAAQCMDQVVATDRQRVAVTGHHEHRQVVPGGRHPGGDGRGTAVDGVHPVAVHVVREPGGTPDPGHDHGVLASDPELRHEAEEGGQDRVVATTGAPAHLLVGGEVLAGQRLDGQRD